MKNIILTSLVSLLATIGFSQTVMIELDESLSGKKHVLSTISAKDGKVKTQEFEKTGEAKIAMVEAIEAMNLMQLTVSNYTTTEYDVEDDVFIRYSFVLTLDMSMPPPMPGGMPEQPGMEQGMPDGMQGGGPGGPPPAPNHNGK